MVWTSALRWPRWVQTLAVEDRPRHLCRRHGATLDRPGGYRSSAPLEIVLAGSPLRGQALAKIGATNLAWSSFWSRRLRCPAERAIGRQRASFQRRRAVEPRRRHGGCPCTAISALQRARTADARWKRMRGNQHHAQPLQPRRPCFAIARNGAPGGLGQSASKSKAGLIGSGRVGPVRLRGDDRTRDRSCQQAAAGPKCRLIGAAAGRTDWEGCGRL